MGKYSIIIGCEIYQDSGFPTVPFAANDAYAFGTTLQQHGFESDDQIVLVNESATKSIVESRIRKTLRAATAEDVAYLFFSAHGFSQEGGNYLTCHDTQLDDLPETSVSLSWVTAQITKSLCGTVVIFLDGAKRPADDKVLPRGLDGEAFQPHVGDTPNAVCFASCQFGETSWPSGSLNHGVWAYHLIEAFNGDAPAALTPDKLLTADSLQDHLATSVARTLRTAYVDEKAQTPLMFGGQNREVILADLQNVLERRHTSDFDANRLLRVAFLGEKAQGIQSLSGFIKGRHRIPDLADDTATAFAGRIALTELTDDLDATHAALKSAFNFKRADLEVGDPEGGSGTIITPYFTYNVNVLLNPNAPAEVLWRREVADIKQPGELFSDAFATVFANLFNTLAFTPPTAIDLLALIDRVEDLADDRLTVHYDRDNTWCKLTIAGQEGEVHVTRDSLRVVKQRSESPRALAQSFFEIQRALVDCHNVRLIPFEDA